MRVLLVCLVLTACGGAATDAAPPLVEQGRAEFSVPGALVQPTLEATEMWRDAGYYVPAVVIGAERPAWKMMLHSGLINHCKTPRNTAAIGCTEQPVLPGDSTLIRISTEVADDILVSVIAHEIGHALGLDDTAGAVMDPWRDMSGAVCTPSGVCVDVN